MVQQQFNIQTTNPPLDGLFLEIALIGYANSTIEAPTTADAIMAAAAPTDPPKPPPTCTAAPVGSGSSASSF
jgi:hypothetical protein